jgi:flagellar biosynthesis anti-sigma factor FlgM
MRFRRFPVTFGPSQQPRRGCRVAKGQPATPLWSEVEVNASDAGKSARHIDPLSGPAPQTRADKIAQLRRAVESGTYSVSAEQLAEKMLREVLVETLTQGLRR